MSVTKGSGCSSWRVRYWRADGSHGSIPGFPTNRAAEAQAREIETGRHRCDVLDALHHRWSTALAALTVTNPASTVSTRVALPPSTAARTAAGS